MKRDWIHDSDLYAVWKNEELEYVVVDFKRRIPVELFERWYAGQSVYRKVSNKNSYMRVDGI